MFSKPLSPFQEPKTNKRIFQSEPEVLPCFELNYKCLERHKKPLSLATKRKQKKPVNTAQKFNQTRRRSDNGRSARVDCHIDMSSENAKTSTSTSVRRLQLWYLEKYKTELNFNLRSKRVRLTLLLINFANAMTVLTVDFEMAFWSTSSG